MQAMRQILGVLAVVLAAAGGLPAQELTAADNPLQKEFGYQVGEVLSPRLNIAGVRWLSFSVTPKEGKALKAGDEIPVVMSLELENTTTSTVEVLAIFLLEDEQGAQLARLEGDKIKLKGERRSEESTKLKVDGGALAATRKIWAYIDVQ